MILREEYSGFKTITGSITKQRLNERNTCLDRLDEVADVKFKTMMKEGNPFAVM